MRPLSIFSSESFQIHIRPSRKWLGLLAPLILAEALLRIPFVTAYLPRPEPTLWYSPLVQAKLDYLKDFQRKHRVDVLFVGHSAVQTGINPEVFDEEYSKQVPRAGKAFNGGLEGLPPYGVHFFLDIYLRYANPQTIIYGLLPGDLSSANPLAKDMTEQLEQCAIAQVEAQRGLRGWIFARLFRWSQLFRYRVVLLQLLLKGGRPKADPVYFDYRGFYPQSRRLTDIPPSDRDALLMPYLYANYAIGGRQTEELQSIIELCRQKGIQLVLVNMPVASGYESSFGGTEIYPSYLATLQRLSTQNGVRFWDAGAAKIPQALDDSDFQDLHHLNRFGASKLSTLLAQRFSQILYPGGILARR